MARILVMTIQFIGTNPPGSYVAGDVLRVYYDPVYDPTPLTGGIIGYSVTKNGTDIFSGSDISSDTQSYKYVSFNNPLICNSTTKIGVNTSRNSFPYAQNVLFPNSPSCGFVAVCDLTPMGVPQVTPVSSDSATDGEILVQAFSSQPIEYKLGSDFVYGDGTASPSGNFTGLARGNYRVYIRDAYNCSLSVFVIVTIDSSYGDFKRLTYTDRLNHKTTILMRRKGMTAIVPAPEVKGSGNPFSVSKRGEGNNDKFWTLFQTTAQWNLTSVFNFEYQELFTNNPKEFKIYYLKDLPEDYNEGSAAYNIGDKVYLFNTGLVYVSLTNGNIDNRPSDSPIDWEIYPMAEFIRWVGYVLPQQLQEDYKAPPYYVTVNAKDGISDLKNFLFVQDDGQLFSGRVKIIELLAFVLNKTGLRLPIRCGVNLYASTMATSSSDDPFDQGYIDPETFYLTGSVPTLEFVLQELLRPFRASLVQWNGCWNIYRIEEQVADYYYREFSSLGAYVTYGTASPLKDVNIHLTPGALEWSQANQVMELRPGYGKVRVIYHLGAKRNILKNGDFRLQSSYNVFANAYIYAIDKTGWELVAPYPMSESAEFLDDGNVAYVMSSQGPLTTGEAYLQSETYQVAMGVNNSLKISVVFKIPTPVAYGLAMNTDTGYLEVIFVPVKPPYIKVRMVVQYGNRYLQTDGTWNITYSELTCYTDVYGQYQSFEIVALQPDSSFAVAQDFKVKVFHAWKGHAEFTTLAAMKAKITAQGNDRGNYDASVNLFPSTGGSGGGGSIVQGDFWHTSVPGTLGGTPVVVGTLLVAAVNSPAQDPNKWVLTNASSLQALPVGTKTELNDPGSTSGYYELQESTDADDDTNIIRPDDYNAGTNPVQWLRRPGTYSTTLGAGILDSTQSFYIDKISVEFLDQGKPIFDTAIRELPAEDGNNLVLQEEVYFGSLLSVFDTAIVQAVSEVKKFDPFDLSGAFQGILAKLSLPRISNFLITQSVLSAQLVYDGFVSDASDVGYVDWARRGVLEARELHDIFMRSAASQFASSWRKITGNLNGDTYFGFLNILREVRQGNTLYLPQALTINDKNNDYEGEFLELIDITEPSEDGHGFTTGFTVGFDS